MELSLRLDTLGIAEVHYLRGRGERYLDWPPFLLLAASRQARILAYMTREAAELLHQQVLTVEAAAGLDVDDEAEDKDEDEDEDEASESESTKSSERESSTFSPPFAQTLEKLNDLARQRLPDAGGGGNPTSSELSSEETGTTEEEDALEQLQDAFVQMMEVVRELAEELPTVELQLDVDDFSHLHETLDFALNRERTSRRRRR